MTDTTQDTAAITVPLDLFKRLVEMADRAATDDGWDERPWVDIETARLEIEQVEALLASPLE